jgi:hypothetical protein
MVGVSLRELKQKFSDVVIVGSGPTNFDYADFKQIHEPIVFINQSHQFSEVCASRHQYFVTHHIMSFPRVRPVTVFLERFFVEGTDYGGVLIAKTKPRGPYFSVDAQAEDEVITKAFMRQNAWMLDRDQVVEKNRLMALFGSTTTALHLAWLMGATRVRMIGCNPDSTTDRHDSRIEGKMTFSPDKVKQNTRLVPGYFDLRVTHV